MAQRKGRQKKTKTQRGTAPSSADIESLEKMEASDEAKEHQPSDVDAMGQDKRREIVGHAYGPSRKSQVIFFVAAAAVLVIVFGGYALAIATFDQPADEYPDKSPWSAADAEQIPTRDPSGPCGEPGNPYPFPDDSPCATGKTATGELPSASTESGAPSGDRAPGQEEGSGGVTGSGGEAGSGGSAAEGN